MGSQEQTRLECKLTCGSDTTAACDSVSARVEVLDAQVHLVLGNLDHGQTLELNCSIGY